MPVIEEHSPLVLTIDSVPDSLVLHWEWSWPLLRQEQLYLRPQASASTRQFQLVCPNAALWDFGPAWLDPPVT